MGKPTSFRLYFENSGLVKIRITFALDKFNDEEWGKLSKGLRKKYKVYKEGKVDLKNLDGDEEVVSFEGGRIISTRVKWKTNNVWKEEQMLHYLVKNKGEEMLKELLPEPAKVDDSEF